MTVYKLGLDQKEWLEAKKALLPPPKTLSISLDEGGSTKEHADAMDNEVQVRLDIHHVDVGQGESTLFTVMAESTCICSVLIDAGLELEGGGMLVRLLHRLGIEYLDAAIVSHFDLDHCAGLIRVLKHYNFFDDGGKPTQEVDSDEEWTPIRVQNIFLRDWPTNAKTTAATETIAEILNDYEEDRVHLVKKDDELLLDCDADQGLFKMTCLAVNWGDPSSKDYENAASIAWLVELGKHTYYTAGDLPTEDMGIDLEDTLGPIIKAKWGSIFAMKCGHHGAETSTSPKFLADVAPSFAFISAGKQDGFSHPRTQTFLSLYGQPSVAAVFMTNCMYNRPWVNGAYLNTAHGDIRRFVGGAHRVISGLRSRFPVVPPGCTAVKESNEDNLDFLVKFLAALDASIDQLGQISRKLALVDGASVDTGDLAGVRGQKAALEALMKATNRGTDRALSGLKSGYEVTYSDGSSGDTTRSHLKSDLDARKIIKPALVCLRDAAVLAQELEDSRTAMAQIRANPLHFVIAGSEAMMGNIVLRFFVSDAKLDARVGFVGLHAAGEWRWLSLRSGDVDEMAIKLPTDSYLTAVEVEKLGPLLVPGSPSRDEPEEEKKAAPKKSFKSRLDERLTKRKAGDMLVSDQKAKLVAWEDDQPKPKRAKVAPTKEKKGGGDRTTSEEVGIAFAVEEEGVMLPENDGETLPDDEGMAFLATGEATRADTTESITGREDDDIDWGTVDLHLPVWDPDAVHGEDLHPRMEEGGTEPPTSIMVIDK